jgi:hypothetical protein
MTTHTTPPTSTVRLGGPGDLLAAVPALLGFHPERSLVLLFLEGEWASTVGLVARVDLPSPHDLAQVRACAEQLSVLCARRAAPAAVLVVVDDSPTGTASVVGLPHTTLVRALHTACEEVGTELVAALHVARVVAGARWRSYDGADGGTMGDPLACPAAASQVLHGRVIHRSRDELAALLRPDGDRSASVALAVETAVAAAGRARAQRPKAAARELLSAVLAAVARTGSTAAGVGAAGARRPLSVPEVAALGAALGDHLVRDACFALAGGEQADAAEQLWTELIRALPAPERAEPAVLLAHSCYARGEGPLAGEALRVALDAAPSHRMAGLLDSALQAGLPPHTVRGLATTARDLAAGLGVTLPPVEWQ